MLSRRELLQLGAAASFFPAEYSSFTQDPAFQLPKPKLLEHKPFSKPLTAVIIGHGGRGSLYGAYASQMPGNIKVVGVAEPIPHRNQSAARIHGIPDANRFPTWERVFDRPKWADICIITTPDDLHYGPAMAALKQGYHLLLEKPIAMNWKECNDILKLATKMNAVVGVCHVLRYAPFFQQMKEVVSSGMIGEVMSVQHLEPIEHIHMSHSFVRGNWRTTKTSLPIILAKSCHDLDLLRWIVDKPCRKVSALGTVKYFNERNAPKDAPERCLEGCPASKACPFYAPKVYVTDKLWGTYHFLSEDKSDASIMKELEKSQYGKCVFRTDNDQPDHYTAMMEFDDDVTVTFNMEAMTSYGGRRTRIMGTKGDIVADEGILDVFLFSQRKRVQWDVNKSGADLGGHGGGDRRLLADFLQAVAAGDSSLLTSNLSQSMESHLMGFKAEESRRKGGAMVKMK